MRVLWRRHLVHLVRGAVSSGPRVSGTVPRATDLLVRQAAPRTWPRRDTEGRAGTSGEARPVHEPPEAAVPARIVPRCV
jgi:hypothetical protein